MQREHIEIGIEYQHRDHKRPGVAVKIDDDAVVLRDPSGDNFRVDHLNLRYAPVYCFGDYWIDLNSNEPRERADGTLCRKLPPERCHITDYEVIGEARLMDEYSEQWVVLVNALWDEETESDLRVVGYFRSQKAALEALWNERENVVA